MFDANPNQKTKYFLKNNTHWEDYIKKVGKGQPIDDDYERNVLKHQYIKMEKLSENEMHDVSPQIK